MEHEGYPKAEWINDEKNDMFTIIFPYPTIQITGTKEKTEERTIEKTSKKTIEKTKEKIIRLIKENSTVTIQELSKETGLSTQGVIWNLKKLKKEKVIKRIGPDKGGHWDIIQQN